MEKKDISAGNMCSLWRLFFEQNLLRLFLRALREPGFKDSVISALRREEEQNPGRVFVGKPLPYESRLALNGALSAKGVSVMRPDDLDHLNPIKWVPIEGNYEWILVEPLVVMDEVDAREEIARRGLEPLNADEGMLFLDTCYEVLKDSTTPIVCLDGGHYENGRIHGHLVFNSFMGKITPIVSSQIDRICAFAAKRRVLS